MNIKAFALKHREGGGSRLGLEGQCGVIKRKEDNIL